MYAQPLQRDLASRNKELATAQADNIQSQEDLTEVIRKATKVSALVCGCEV